MVEESGKPEMWGHFHPSDKKRSEEECRLFEVIKNLSNYGVGRLVYNKYEQSYDSRNYEILTNSGENSQQIPETFWVSHSEFAFWEDIFFKLKKF